MNSIRITLISLFLASSAHAEEIVKFVSLDACKTYYAKSVTPVANETADTYCKDRIMSFLEACTATKIAEYVTAQKLKAFTDLSDSEQRNKKANFSYQCQVASQNQAAGNAKIASDQRAAQQAASRSTATTGASGSNSAQSAAQTGALLTAMTPLVTNLANDIDKAQRAASAGTQATGAAAKPAATSASGTTQPAPAAANTSGQPTAATAQQPAPAAQPASQPTPAAESAATPTTAAGPTQSELAGLDPKTTEAALDPQASATAATTAKGEIGGAASDTIKEMPETKSAVDELSSTTAKVNEGTSPPEPTAITQSAEATSKTMQSKIDGIVNTAQNQSMGAEVQYTQTATAFTNFRTESFKYTNSTKSTCANLAEKASYLCVEGTSPGAIAAKKIMDASGPILAVANSAIKTCSSTAKVTKLVGLGLTVAKGVCISSKLACDVSCASAVKDLGQLQASIQPKIGAAINSDWTTNEAKCKATAAAQCTAATVAYAACYNPKYETCAMENERIKQSMIAQAKALVTPLQTENNAATTGTSPAIVKGCQGHTKDILLFALQAAGSFVAQKNAKACEEKLASSGAAANTVTTQQYCEKSENASTQLCICQKNSMASGCPGAVLTDSTSSSPSSDKGTNIKGVGGNSAFAGGFGSGNKSKPGNSSLGKDSINNALGLGSASGDGSAGGLDGSGGGGLAGGGGGGLGGAPSPSAETASKKEAEEKKKWSFGAFGSDSGGLGGAGGTAANGKYKSGALTTGDQAAIQRQIASEKYAAEISTASGKSNWEKIRNMYLIKENSFIFGQ